MTGVTAADGLDLSGMAAWLRHQADEEIVHANKFIDHVTDRGSDAAGDLSSRPLLNWFLEEQIEEEATVSEIVGQLELVGDDGSGLLRMDTRLSSRPTETTEPA
ncbi:hypothetical protein NWP10_05285 [Micrococcus sp. HG099]|uniref:ferritin n=1 Tax=Micrococcus TaxID=1269 RepID=UPI00215ACDEC|nr:ferritin-like domain-containing protein [Micrococcus sp. HG099]MCR8675223.1 hypothetical protein [Micrococcus sp. HG099]